MQWKDLLIFIVAYFLGSFIAGFIRPLIPASMPFASVLILILPPTVIWFVLKQIVKRKVV